MNVRRWLWVACWCAGVAGVAAQQPFRVMCYNVENLFDCRDDSLKADEEFMPGGERRWTRFRYWRKLNAVAKVVAAVAEERLPDMIGLCEVENDSVLFDLVARSSLRTLGYRGVMTHSPDVRGMDVALLYQPGSFRLLESREWVIPSEREGFRPTRNLLYVKGQVLSGDTLHVVVCHWPSRLGKTLVARRHRQLAARTLRRLVDSVESAVPFPRVLVMGDFNAGREERVLSEAFPSGYCVPERRKDRARKVHGTYRYQGIWETIDHVWVSPALMDVRNRFHTLHGNCRIVAFHFMYEPDKTYGGIRPFRTYQGTFYRGGYSDHFPLLLDFEWRFPEE